MRTLLSPYLTFFLISSHYVFTFKPLTLRISKLYRSIASADDSADENRSPWQLWPSAQMPRCEVCALGRIADVRGNLSAHVNKDAAPTSIKPRKSFIIMACLFVGPVYLQCLHWGALQCKLGLHAIYYAKTAYEMFGISVTFLRGEKCMKNTVFSNYCNSSTHIKQWQINGSRDVLSGKLHTVALPLSVMI